MVLIFLKFVHATGAFLYLKQRKKVGVLSLFFFIITVFLFFIFCIKGTDSEYVFKTSGTSVIYIEAHHTSNTAILIVVEIFPGPRLGSEMIANRLWFWLNTTTNMELNDLRELLI